MKNAKNIILGVTGGIAAYKSAELIRRLQDYDYAVQAVMTDSAKQFITPLTLQALSGHRVRDDLFDVDAELGMGHIELARWADAIVIAPCTAHFIAKLAQGQANDLISTLCLATAAPIFIAPSMNQLMWNKTSVQANLKKLVERGFKILGPECGEQACGDYGLGRMLEPMAMAVSIHEFFNPAVLAGKRVLITAGPTREAFDPVRYISNRSSGKMGFALAKAARALGAEVTLVAGPVNLPTPKGVKRIDVESALDMLAAVEQAESDIFIAAAAVADYRVEKQAEHKIKKQNQVLAVNLVKNPDILATVAEFTKKPYCVGFAIETENLTENARQKLIEKNLDMVVGNIVSEHTGFGVDSNEVVVITQDDEILIPLADKTEIAQCILQILIQKLKENNVSKN